MCTDELVTRVLDEGASLHFPLCYALWQEPLSRYLLGVWFKAQSLTHGVHSTDICHK